MRDSEKVCWSIVECACRILGVSTATVLCAVGVETLKQGDFSSLGIYLVVSSVGIMMFELAYFLDTLLLMCLPCPPDWQLFLLWGKMARIGGFHKFLYYSIMSVVCFLHPVLVWHAIIPVWLLLKHVQESSVRKIYVLVAGTMLLVTAFFNFILSKKTKIESPKRHQGLTTVCVAEGAASNDAVSFLHAGTGRRGAGRALAARDRCPGPGERGESVRTTLELEQTTAPKGTDRDGSRWKERRPFCLRGREEPVGREMEDMDSYCEPEADTTSDTAPMITD